MWIRGGEAFTRLGNSHVPGIAIGGIFVTVIDGLRIFLGIVREACKSPCDVPLYLRLFSCVCVGTFFCECDSRPYEGMVAELCELWVTLC